MHASSFLKTDSLFHLYRLASSLLATMAEKADEFHMQLEPADKVVFKGKKLTEEPTLAEIKITNTTKERQVFKVKCTSNEMFRIRPPVAALKPDESVVVQVTFKGSIVPENGKHYFAVYHIKSDDDKKAPRQVWEDHKGQPDGTKRLIIHFHKEHDADKNLEDNKPEDNKPDDKEPEDKKVEVVVKKEVEIEVKKEVEPVKKDEPNDEEPDSDDKDNDKKPEGDEDEQH
jgi:hypothetical protein